MDESRYAQLLADARPRIIETPEEHERLMAIAEQLMEKSEQISEEEEKLLTLLVLLIEAFESSAEEAEEDEAAFAPPKPFETLRRLMEARGLDPQDIVHFFGNPRILTEVLEGRREISRGQAKDLGKFFQMPAKLFHS